MEDIHIDLGIYRKCLNERFFIKRQDSKVNFQIDQANQAKFGAYVKRLLSAIFRGKTYGLGIKITGSRSEIKTFVKAIEAEKSYVYTAWKYGLDDLRTYKNKLKLDVAIDRFERKTGLRWPLES